MMLHWQRARREQAALEKLKVEVDSEPDPAPKVEKSATVTEQAKHEQNGKRRK
jgi:hypothetical protein